MAQPTEDESASLLGVYPPPAPDHREDGLACLRWRRSVILLRPLVALAAVALAVDLLTSKVSTFRRAVFAGKIEAGGTATGVASWKVPNMQDAVHLAASYGCVSVRADGTDSGFPCIFPFTYQGSVYRSCTSVESSMPWCSTQVDGTGNHVLGQWGFCLCEFCPCNETDARVAWMASPFGSCMKECGGLKFRELECRSVFDDKLLPPAACEGPRPATSAACSCELVVCEKRPLGGCPGTAAARGVEVNDGDESNEYRPVGCFAFSGPWSGHLFDTTCQKWSTSTPCLSGLPFYSYTSRSMDAKKCLNFCLRKGLDIFGIEGGTRCRCGASAVNREVWQEKLPRPGLLFLPSAVLPTTMLPCPLQIYRYTGHYESGGVPFGYTDFLEADLQYMDSIVSGRNIDEAIEEDGPLKDMQEDAPQQGLAQQQAAAAVAVGFERPCWPSNCGPGRGPWQDRVAEAPLGTPDVYEEYVLIDYWFDDNVDSGRKDTFRQAADVWRRNTCINLIEVAQPEEDMTGIQVVVESTDGCWLMGMGYPGRRRSYVRPSVLNLGWCKDVRHRGNIVHEIGHALGMNHEQKRPDAGTTYQGHGPHLKLYWQNIPGDWVPQYTPDYSSYTGSANDGENDPKVGFADYDFGSIMHYPGGDRYDTIPAEQEAYVGNRRHLSSGDIAQIRDIYQCKLKQSTTLQPAGYEMITSGRCTNPITTFNECTAAAHLLSLDDTTTSDDGQRGAPFDPPFCYYEWGQLKYNVQGGNTGQCSKTDRCLCLKAS